MPKLLIFSVSLLFILGFSKCESLISKIVDGAIADIYNFTYSAFVHINCVTETGTSAFICGSSILNEYILLTACHCFHKCTNSSNTTVSVGNIHRKKGVKSTVQRYVCHEDYSEINNNADIALLKLTKPLKLNDKVQRVVIEPNPPYYEKAEVAGWGLINETNNLKSSFLQYVKQYALNRDYCEKIFSTLPRGAFCASSGEKQGYASRGDSGSAMVVRGYIQIGIVSYKKMYKRNLVVYTDVGYFYNWIRKAAKLIMCYHVPL